MKKLLFAGLLLAQAGFSQDHFMHDRLDDIMEISNPACLINGVVKVVRDEVSSRGSYRYVDEIRIKPEWFKWEDEC
ncbi:MAG: hypothetical protein VW518_00380, partial [Burkholderiaceae bacterium]